MKDVENIRLRNVFQFHKVRLKELCINSPFIRRNYVSIPQGTIKSR